MSNDVKKFLDEEGIKVLWNQVNLNDYPNNETLIAVINAIDETKANASDLQTTQDSVNVNTANIATLQSQVLQDSLILADAITGHLYTIQIQDGQLVSFRVEE